MSNHQFRKNIGFKNKLLNLGNGWNNHYWQLACGRRWVKMDGEWTTEWHNVLNCIYRIPTFEPTTAS